VTHEEMERAIEFILKQQAQFSADIQRINETLDRHNEVFRKQTDALVALTGWHGKLVEAQIHLTEVQQGHDARIATIETKLAEIAEAGKRTDERLDALITTVDRYISSRDVVRGGKRRGRRPAK
jgi:hypothetical protein